MTNPIVDLIGDRTGRIVPIYPQSEKAQVTTWELAGWVENAIERCRPRGILDPVPESVRRRLELVDRGDALRAIHLPETIAEKQAARRRLAFDELLRVQLVLVRRKRAIEDGAVGISHQVGGELVRRFHAALPYPLTGAQRRVIAEIDADLAAPHPMHRLLQGDVGSGKTVVALTALLAAVEGGLPGGADGADRGARRAARGERAGDGRRSDGAPARQPVRRAAAARRAADEPRHRRGASGAARRPRRRTRRHRDRHPRPHPGGGRLPPPRRGRRRRAAPLRRRAAGGAARQGRPGGARRAGDDGDADPAHRGDDGVRRPRRERARRAAAGPDADRHPQRGRPARPRRGVGRRAHGGGGRAPGLRRVPADRGVREARGGVGRGDLPAVGRRRAGGPAPRAAPRADAVGREGGGDGPLPRRRDRRARGHHRDRGGRRRAQRLGDGDPRRRSVRHRPAAPAARAGGTRGGEVAVLAAGRRRVPTSRAAG